MWIECARKILCFTQVYTSPHPTIPLHYRYTAYKISNRSWKRHLVGIQPMRYLTTAIAVNWFIRKSVEILFPLNYLEGRKCSRLECLWWENRKRKICKKKVVKLNSIEFFIWYGLNLTNASFNQFGAIEIDPENG